MKKLLREKVEFKNIDEKSAKAILGILGTKINLTTIRIQDKNGKERYNMCKAFDDYKEEGRIEGEFSMALKTVKYLMKNQKISCTEAMNLLGISKKMRNKIESLV